MLSGQGFRLQKDYNILLGMFVQKGWEPLHLNMVSNNIQAMALVGIATGIDWY